MSLGRVPLTIIRKKKPQFYLAAKLENSEWKVQQVTKYTTAQVLDCDQIRKNKFRNPTKYVETKLNLRFSPK